MPSPNEQNLSSKYRIVLTRTTSGVLRESMVPSPVPYPGLTAHSNASTVSILTNVSITGTGPTSCRAPESNVGSQDIDKWVKTGTIGTEEVLEVQKHVLVDEGGDGKTNTGGKGEEETEGKTDGKREEKKEEERGEVKLDPSQCWNCKAGPLIWAEEGDHFLVCRKCGEPS